MTDIDKDLELDDEDSLVVVMTDEEGNEYYYTEEMIIPVGDKNFAILVPLAEGDDCECGCEEDGDGDVDVFIARIDIDESGEEVYVDPTDEEFDAVRAAYEELMEDEEDED